MDVTVTKQTRHLEGAYLHQAATWNQDGDVLVCGPYHYALAGWIPAARRQEAQQIADKYHLEVVLTQELNHSGTKVVGYYALCIAPRQAQRVRELVSFLQRAPFRYPDTFDEVILPL